MPSNKRKSLRRSIERYVWIDLGDGSALNECALGNMSETGAKLILAAPKEFPKQFILRLSKDGRVARKCRIAWTAGNEIGVLFTARLVSGATRVAVSVEG